MFALRRLLNPDYTWRRRDLKKKYDVVIVGAGVHGLATAYYLCKAGVKDVAVLDKGYIGGGASARSTAILRATYVTPEGIDFFHESLKLYEGLSQDLDFNLLFSQFGRIELAHNDSSIYALRIRADFNAAMGVDSRIIGPSEIKDMVPVLDMGEGGPLPIMAGLYHPPGGVIRHDAVIWGYARGVDRRGGQVHPFTEVTGFMTSNGRVTGVRTPRGDIEAGTVVNCTAAMSSELMRLLDFQLPMVTHQLQALVTEPLKPFLHTGISSANLHVYIYQTDRGELVIGGGSGPLSFLLAQVHVSTAGEPCLALAGVAAIAARCQRSAPMDRDMRHDAGLCADHGPDAGPGRACAERWMGHVRVQGRADWRQDHCGVRHYGQAAEADRAVLHHQVPRRAAREREGGGFLSGAALARGAGAAFDWPRH